MSYSETREFWIDTDVKVTGSERRRQISHADLGWDAAADVIRNEVSGDHTEHCRFCGAEAFDATLIFFEGGYFIAECNLCGHAEIYDYDVPAAPAPAAEPVAGAQLPTEVELPQVVEPPVERTYAPVLYRKHELIAQTGRHWDGRGVRVVITEGWGDKDYVSAVNLRGVTLAEALDAARAELDSDIEQALDLLAERYHDARHGAQRYEVEAEIARFSSL